MRSPMTLFLVFLGIVSVMTAWAEDNNRTLKIGSVDLDRLMVESTTIRRMVESVQDEVKKEQETMTDKMTRYKVLTETYEQQKSILTEEQRQTRRKEIDELKAQIEEQQDKVNRIIKRSERNLLEPTLARVEEAIKAVGKEEGYDLILRNDTVLFASERCDITDRVIRMIDKMAQEKTALPSEDEATTSTTNPIIPKMMEKMFSPVPSPTPTTTTY